MNIIPRGKGTWDVESESRKNKFYQVIFGSKQAKSYGVDYSCNCKSWINNTNGDRTCKHTIEIQAQIMGKVTSKYTRPASKRVGRGRPSYAEMQECEKCGKSTSSISRYGYCKNCGTYYMKDSNGVYSSKGMKEKAEKIMETVRLEKSDFQKADELLGL